MLKRIWQKIIKEQKGQTLPLVLILMLIGGLLVVPTLNYASTSLKAKQVTEKKTLELYAADAGVEEALSYLSQLAGNWSAPPHPVIGPYKWSTPGGGHYGREAPQADELVINGKTVFPVTVWREGPEESPYYNITSTATSTDDADGSCTTVTSYAKFLDFSCLFDKLVTSKKDIGGNGAAEIDPEEKAPYYEGAWPRADDLSTLYWGDVKGLEPFTDDIDISSLPGDPHLIEPLYYKDGSLNICNEGSAGKSAALNGTVYVTDNPGVTYDLKIGTTNQNFTLDLSGETIYCEGGIKVGNQCTITGAGCIIAVGDIFFSPGIETCSSDFVFIMSVESTVYISPNANFYGAIAGADTVTLQPGQPSYIRTLPPEDWDPNFLGGTDAPITILSWQIS